MVERKEYIEDLINFKDKNIIKVIIGIRRCGKSTLFELYQKYLLNHGVTENQIISINLEGGEFRIIKNEEQLYDYVCEKLLPDTMNYVFLDEIQQISDFQKAVDWLYVKKNVDLYITGSIAFLLSGELATLLSGRYVEIKMLPLSFKEYVSAFPDNQNMPALYMNYLTNSSFPGTLELSRKKDIRAYLEGIYNTILMKDIVTRRKITNPTMLESVIEFLFDNIGNMCSARKVANSMTSAGRKISVPTVESYITALKDSFIIYKADRYDVKGKQYLTTGAKYYAADIGLRYFLLGTRQTDMGHILENIVYLELLRRGYEVSVGKVGDAQVDFIAVNEEGAEYYQVSQTVMDSNTLKRELSSLEAIHDHNPKYLLTMDFTPLTSYNGIKQINVLDWLLK
ncbi:ATP-binding protein [Faecalicatena sp. AGMB00832]|uniref:ATP-binding protein n=1 Tax=Faecalicatena faecalis TaxID=2726362 RepID=A0ABS6D328_9FIRM|nr:ATP-binding protein [Faecalicatena faecalis]MBU3875856.1 ATP-binding protein [Faecalicatena faecalis]